MKSALTVSFLVLLAGVIAGSTCITLFKQDAFSQLNKFLEEHESSDDLEANINAATKILAGNSDNPKLVELTKHFVALRGIKQINWCGTKQIRLVASAFNALQEYVKDPTKDERRLSRLVVGLTANCLPKLVHDFAQVKLKKPDYRLDEFTSYLTLECRQKEFQPLDKMRCSLKKRNKSLNSLFDPNNIFMGLLDLKGTKAFNESIDKSEVRKLINSNLVDACDVLMYSDERIEIIEDVISNLSTLRLTDDLVRNYDMNMGDLLGGVANYLTCERLRATDVDKLIDNVHWWFRKSKGTL